MKIFKDIKNVVLLSLVIIIFLAPSCKKVLEQQPLSAITPDKYLNEESQLGAYAIARYGILPSHGNFSFGTFGIDANTDNMATPNIDNRWVPGLWRVGSGGGDWDFGNIFQMN